MIPTTFPVGTTPDAFVAATATSVSSAVSGASPPASSFASTSAEDVSLSSSAVPVMIIPPGRIHWDSGKISTATKSPSMARFIAARPLSSTPSPVPSFITCASKGLYLDVRTPPLINFPLAKPSLMSFASRYASKTLALAPPPLFARLASRSSSGISAPPPGTTKSTKLASFEIDCIHSITLITSIFSSRAFLAFPRSFVTSVTRSHAARGIARR
mmetsp:Transcript_10/g.44  ORF Transcript_10/g.44 Transcript_10/m.44 type:complete len:215 (+) Transcript_10:2620-3264(+)